MRQLYCLRWCRFFVSLFNGNAKPVLTSTPPSTTLVPTTLVSNLPLPNTLVSTTPVSATVVSTTSVQESEHINAVVENRSSQTTPDVYIDEKTQIELMNSENNAEMFGPESKN